MYWNILLSNVLRIELFDCAGKFNCFLLSKEGHMFKSAKHATDYMVANTQYTQDDIGNILKIYQQVMYCERHILKISLPVCPPFYNPSPGVQWEEEEGGGVAGLALVACRLEDEKPSRQVGNNLWLTLIYMP